MPNIMPSPPMDFFIRLLMNQPMSRKGSRGRTQPTRMEVSRPGWVSISWNWAPFS